MEDLPIEPLVTPLRETLRTHTRVVLQAPPGAGKTTRVPLALLDEPWLAGGRILMLEPRRLATRGAARRMATLLGERVGETVGYRMRMDTQVGPHTRVEVVTEGILTRRLHADPALDGVGLLIFDEFHERNLNSDLGLALALQSQTLVREDLRILAMSATLDGAAVAALFGGAPVLTSEGRSYPVDVRYVGRRPEVKMESAVISAIRDTIGRDDGDVLVFLPGAGEIRRVAELLNDGTAARLPAHVRVTPLYGNLPQQAQDAAIAPSRPGQRKIVLSTSIAETSLTIEGVRVVIDSGVMRVPRFSARSGMTRLETVRVSRASADQRCGRAGRLGPGVCYRLWAEQEQHHLVPHRTPEILEADLAPLALELAVAGITDPGELAWLDAPPVSAYVQGRALLRSLGALDVDGRITAHGRQMAELAMHPRLSHMVLEGERLGHGVTACYLAALLNERDVLYADSGSADADVRLRLEAVAQVAGGTGHPQAMPETSMQELREFHGFRVDRQACRRIVAEGRQWWRQLQRVRAASSVTGGSLDAGIDPTVCGVLLAFAYPDRIAQRRPGTAGRFVLRTGQGAALATVQPLSTAPYLAVADLDGKLPESKIFLAAALDLDEIETQFGAEIDRHTIVTWDDDAGAVRASLQERLGVLVLQSAPMREPDPGLVTTVFLDGIRRRGASALPWTDAARRTQARLCFMHTHHPEWPDVSDDVLMATLETWLAPHVYGLTRVDDLRRLDVAGLLLGLLTWEQRASLDERAPTHYVVPSGSRIAIDYDTPEMPVLAVRLQEMFGLQETPSIDRGTLTLTLHLLSPAHRPVQVTRDLAGFWRTSYFDVKKDLKGRYPKHPWPDDPLQATPTRRAKPRG
jgi:ATP-dependent helicase HrpB